MESQFASASKYLDAIGGGYTDRYLKSYIEKNISAKSGLNNLLGLNAENDYTVALPIILDDATIKSNYIHLTSLFTDVLVTAGYSNIDYVKGTIVSPKGATVKLTRIIPKFQEQIIVHPCYQNACRELGISDCSFASIGPRLGELANNKDQELFITSSIAEFMQVNRNSSYTSCYKHGILTETSYWSGTLSYGLDNFTLLVGIRNKDTKYKTGRSWLWLFPDGINSAGTDHQTPFMVQPKSYGEFTTCHRKAVRAYIQERINSSETWKVGTRGAISYESLYGYIDNYDLSFSYLKGENKPQDVHINFYSDLWCLSCGDTDVTDGTGQCLSCGDTDVNGICCAECGERVDPDDAYTDPNGNQICIHCYNNNYFYCEHCEEDCYIDDLVTVEGGRNGSENMCKHCAENGRGIFYCDECDTYYFNSHTSSYDNIDGEVICENCANYFCDECGVASKHGGDFVTTTDNITYCRDCADSNTFTCKECGEVFSHNAEACVSNICESCYVEEDEAA